MHFRQKKSVREIARITLLSRNTVRKWIAAPLEKELRFPLFFGYFQSRFTPPAFAA
jgi:transposase